MSHPSAKNPLLLTALSAQLGATCRDHVSRPAVVCSVAVPASAETWALEVRPQDDVAWQQPHRLLIRIQFPALRAERVAEFRGRVFGDWRPLNLDPCMHSVWQPGPVPETLSLAYVGGRMEGGCIDRVEHVDLLVYSSRLPFPAPRIR